MVAFSIFLLELWLLTAIIIVFHQQRKRLGIIPLTFVMVYLSVLLTIAPIINVKINSIPWINLTLPSFVFAPLIITAFLLIYMTEGAHIAQLVLFGMVIISCLSIVIFGFLLTYSQLPPSMVIIPEILSASNLLTRAFLIRCLASFAGFTMSMITIVISYQFMDNYLSAIPQYVRFGIALMSALWVDSIVFFLISGFGFSNLFSSFGEFLLNKTVAVMSLLLPVSFYINTLNTVQNKNEKNRSDTLAILYGTVGKLRNSLVHTQSKLNTSQDQYHKLAQKIMITQEEERSHIARELHDEAGQELTALKISLESMLLVRDEDTLRANLLSVISLVDDTLENIRLLAKGLHPPELKLLGLNRTLASVCEEVAEISGIHISYTGHGDGRLDQHPDTIAITLYRILQETLTNVIRHANATTVMVDLQQKSETITLSVKDNGDGFDFSTIHNRTGIGLTGMGERVELLNGILQVYSSPNDGTQIIAQIPMEIKS